MYAMLTLIYYIVIIFKNQKALFIVYVVAIAPAFILSFLLVKNLGVIGGAISYLISITGITLALYVIAKKNLNKSTLE